jgi:hypothetical protein
MIHYSEKVAHIELVVAQDNGMSIFFDLSLCTLSLPMIRIIMSLFTRILKCTGYLHRSYRLYSSTDVLILIIHDAVDGGPSGKGTIPCTAGHTETDISSWIT